ncbi:hypothetical protein [Rhodococcus chondri]|uniref:Autophagy-related protein 2 n=1 Tax=Rhodococcus chondri TaxID=3065941 RepID=A0ABU7JNC3_9NOCA|nr:hypothetical protein [Rhodococcus sp. CC-R104]MEE2030959.1 hypothetical protein [Rhodococcus sp. CC-R104]
MTEHDGSTEHEGSTEPKDDLTGEELSKLVDDMEQRVETERDEQNVPGSASDREETKQIEPEDQAPE